MGQLTPSFVMDLEKRMRVVSASEYQRLLANLWWTNVAKEMPSTGKSERLIWMLDSARIDYVNKFGGEVMFEDLVSNTVEYESKTATGGFKLNRNQLDDHNGGGVELAAEWSRQIGAYAAYWPQKQVAAAIRAGGTAGSTAYDGQVFFSGSHPVNPFDSAAGTYSNNFTAGSGPGAVPIGGATTVDVAVANLSAAIAYIASIKMPNGEDPRGLRVSKILVPPALTSRAQQLLDAKMIAQAATGGAGSANVEAIVSGWGLGQPIQCDELGAGFGGSDSTYYLLAESITTDAVGAINYINRDPFEVVYNDQMTDAQLARANELQWLTRGRNVVGYGHPYLLFRCLAA